MKDHLESRRFLFTYQQKLDVGSKLWQVLPSRTLWNMKENIRTFSSITGRLIQEAIQRSVTEAGNHIL